MFLKVKNILLITSVVILSTTSVEAQHISESTVAKIDQIFTKWQGTNNPGYIVGIVRDDSLVFARGYGMANLEYGTPITENTVFYIASVSKQFTAYCIILLARQGRIKLDDDIRIYLPWLPDFKKKITVGNLLNHTSGIRDHLNLIAIGGLGIDGVLANDQVVRTLKMQRSLNFDPGERYKYSNSNYILLAEIVKTVSGKSLRQFADSAIFKPLKMTQTHFHDDPSELVPNRAVSYWQTGTGSYTNAAQNIYTVGDGGIMSTVTDAAKWVMNFYDTKAGDEQDIQDLTKTGKLTGGKELGYASGINVSEERGWKVYSHSGGLHGYSSIISVYPELKIGFIIFGNVRGGLPVNELASLIIEPKKMLAKSNVSSNRGKNYILKDSALLKSYIGEYISEEGYLLRIMWDGSKFLGSGFGQNFEIVDKEKPNTFLFPSRNNPLTKIVFRAELTPQQFDLEFPDEVLRFSRFNDTVILKPEELAGEYYCPELGCTYKIILKDNELFLSNPAYPDSKLVLRGLHLKRSSWFMDHLTVTMDQTRVIGFEVNSAGVMHLPFIKK